MSPNEVQLLALVVGCSALVGIVAIIGGLMHARGKRMQAHAERMKALEMGRGVPDDYWTARVKAAVAMDEDGPGRPASDRCYSVAGKAVFWGFVFAAGSSSAGHGHDGTGVAIAIAAAAGAIGVTSMVCGTVLAAKGVAASSAGHASAPVKGFYDPDGV